MGTEPWVATGDQDILSKVREGGEEKGTEERSEVEREGDRGKRKGQRRGVRWREREIEGRERDRGEK